MVDQVVDRCKMVNSKYVPVVIIFELGTFLGAQIDNKRMNQISYSSKLLEVLMAVKPIKLSNPYTNEDLSNIAHFINYEKHVWSLNILMKSFKNVNKILDNVNRVKYNFEYGRITPDKPKNIDLLLLYYINTKIGLNTTGDPNIWVKDLKLYLSLNKYQLQKNILNNLNKYNKIMLYNLYKSSKIEVLELDYSEIDKIYNLCDIDYIPKTDIEAIVVAGKRDGIDISLVSTPLLTYHKLIENPRYKNCFKKLSLNFNPKLPRCFYKNHVLSKLALMEGYTNKQIKNNDPYILCMETTHLNRFSHGKTDNAINDTTDIYLTSISDLNYHECLSYGVDSKDKQIYTYKEILDTFTSYSDFVLPGKINDFFSPRNIRRLRYLCSGQKYPDERYKYRMNLGKKINQILSSKKIISNEVERLIKFHHKNPSLIRMLIKLLTDLGMYMRGWDGKSSLPILIAISSGDEYFKIESRVRKSIHNLRSLVKREKIKFFLDLPLVRYNNGKFIINTDHNKGLTIGERLNIVLDTKNINSCIRTTSNWILATVARYGILLKVKLSFDIDKVRRIA